MELKIIGKILKWVLFVTAAFFTVTILWTLIDFKGL